MGAPEGDAGDCGRKSPPPPQSYGVAQERSRSHPLPRPLSRFLNPPLPPPKKRAAGRLGGGGLGIIYTRFEKRNNTRRCSVTAPAHITLQPACWAAGPALAICICPAIVTP